MSNRAGFKQIAEETLTILKNGYYEVNGSRIDISNEINDCIQGSRLYDEAINIKIQQLADTHIEVKQCTTLEAVQEELQLDPTISIAALNFASAKNPGGGFLKGSSAQEESIARTSALYPCLTTRQVEQYYIDNAKEHTCVYTDNIIYSPKVPVFRSDSSQGELLPAPYMCSIITSPAVNYKHAIQRVGDHDEVMEIFRKRAGKVIAVAIDNQHDVLILGAWGCGVFGCGIFDTAQMFRHLLMAEGAKYKNAFKRVIFAIRDEKTCNDFRRGLNSEITGAHSAPRSAPRGRGWKGNAKGNRDPSHSKKRRDGHWNKTSGQRDDWD
jgi:uncharacterized protein (TIGR02452 family)